MIYLNLLLISAVICYVIDISGVIDHIKKALWKKYVKTGNPQNLSLKPLDCSRCATWWAGLIYILITGNFTLPLIGFCALLSLLASNITDALNLIKDIVTWLINLVYAWLNI